MSLRFKRSVGIRTEIVNLGCSLDCGLGGKLRDEFDVLWRSFLPVYGSFSNVDRDIRDDYTR